MLYITIQYDRLKVQYAETIESSPVSPDEDLTGPSRHQRDQRMRSLLRALRRGVCTKSASSAGYDDLGDQSDTY